MKDMSPESSEPEADTSATSGHARSDVSDPEMQSAQASYEAGNLKEAEQIYLKILTKHPDDVAANYNLACVLFDEGRPHEAIPYYQRTIERDPDNVGAYNDLGLALHETGQFEEAIKCYRKALLLDAGNVDLYYNLALALEERGDLDEAMECYRKAIELKPDLDDAYNNLGNLFLRKRNFDEAISNYKKAVELNPGLAQAYHNLGYLFYDKGRFEETLGYFQKAMELNPNFAGLYSNLGRTLKEEGRLDEAMALFNKVLAVLPGNSEAYLEVGYILDFQGKNEEAIAAYDKALEYNPDFFLAHYARCMAQLPYIYPDSESIEICREHYCEDLLKLQKTISDLSREGVGRAAQAVGSQQPFLLAYQGFNDRELQQIYGNLVCGIMAAEYPELTRRLPMPTALPEEPIRVGIASGYFYYHSNWKVPIKGWIENLDAEKFIFYGYYTGKKKDNATEAARQSFHRFVEDIYSFDELCRIIREDNLHILIYPEIGMDRMTGRLATLRLAPVQCVSWGHPETSGLSTVDYFLSSDLMEPPDADVFYTEQLIRLPNLSVYFTPVDVPDIKATRETFGLRLESVLYLCSQSLFKYLPQYDDVFPRIAQEVGDCQFLFISDKSEFVTDQFHQRINSAFEKFEMKADDYVVFVPRLDPERYNAINHLSDVFLDTVGWSGCNSTFEALARNLPVVTLPGKFMRGRHSAAILTMMGMTETIAESINDYVEIAVKLAKDSEWRKRVLRKISENKHRIYRDKTCVTALENFLEKVVKEKQS